MKTTIFRFFITALAAFTLFTFNSAAQERTIRGQVFTFDSIPLVNAQIKVKSSKLMVQSDTLGRFSLNCKPGDVLFISAHGFNREKVKIESQTKIIIANLKLKPGVKNREIAIGYGHVTDRDKLVSAASLNNGDLDFSQYSNLYDIIQGRFPGVQIINGEVIIRGPNSINGSNAALIVVDGVPVDNSILNTLPPVMVKSINVIKDGSSAIYGVRGANGVVIIETKRGGD